MSKTFAERPEAIIAPSYPPETMGLTWSQVRARDGLELSQLIHECERIDSALFTMSEAALADMLELGTNLPADAIVGRENGVARAYASVEVLPVDGEVARAEVHLHVHPSARGRGIAEALLAWQQSRAVELLTEVYGSDATLPIEIGAHVDTHIDDRVAILEQAGYKKIRTFEVMYRNFAGKAPEVTRPRGGYTIVPWMPELSSAVRALHLRVFEDHWGSKAETARWWDQAVESVQKRWSFVAISAEGEVVGYMLVGRHPERWIQTGVSEAYAELLGVDSSIRGGGIARALITRAMKAAYDSDVEQFGLDVDVDNPHGAKGFYERLGFEAAGRYAVYGLQL